MDWLDLCGAPGSGKSTISYPIWQDKSVGWDGRLPPAYWKPFLDELTNLMVLVRDHDSFPAVVRMNDRSAKKMSTVERMVAPVDKPVFIQTGLVQRILGFGWRLVDLKRDPYLIARALWLMPVSVGVAFLEASVEEITRRNKMRETVKETAHENRTHQVGFMLEPIRIAKAVLRERGIPVIEIDVEHQSIDAARAQLLDFATRPACDAATLGYCDQAPAILSPPPWWRS